MAAADRAIIDGTPGSTWTNDTSKVRYQFYASLVNTCGVCLQYHGKIGPPWPIPIHHGCRCHQSAVAPGQQAPEPFVDYRKLLDGMAKDQQAAAIGASNYKLLRAGVVAWDDIVTPARVRDLREVVSLKKLSVKTMTAAGVRPRIAEQAYQSVHTPAHELAAAHRRELVERIAAAGLPRDALVRELAARLAGRVAVAAGESYTTKAGTVLPGIAGGRLLGVGPSHFDKLARAMAAVTIARVAMGPKPAPKPPRPGSPAPAPQPDPAGTSPLPLSVHGNVTKEEAEEFIDLIRGLPQPVLEALRKHGVSVAVADRFGSYNARLVGEHPRGHAPHITFQHVEASYLPDSKTVVMCKTRKMGRSYQPLAPRFGVSRHELGHAFDEALRWPSHSAAFRRAYNRDAARLSPEQRLAADDLLQPGDAGREEAFCEVFADLLKGGSAEWFAAADVFPEVAGLVWRKISGR